MACTTRICPRIRLSNLSSAPNALPFTPFPAFCRQSSRAFTSSCQRKSKIGGSPLSIPPGVEFKVLPPVTPKWSGRISRTQPMSTVQVKGPLGEISMQIPPYVTVHQKKGKENAPSIKIQDAEVREQRAMWGTVRAYLANHILGVSEGHTAILRLVGVGYRATIESSATTVQPEFPGQHFVNLKVGYSHPIELGIPQGVKASVPQPTRILLEGVVKEDVMSFAAKIRKWRVPEPYKGKGIFVNGETIRLKNKKIK